jgi:hypothetical protein
MKLPCYYCGQVQGTPLAISVLENELEDILAIEVPIFGAYHVAKSFKCEYCGKWSYVTLSISGGQNDVM